MLCIGQFMRCKIFEKQIICPKSLPPDNCSNSPLVLVNHAQTIDLLDLMDNQPLD